MTTDPPSSGAPDDNLIRQAVDAASGTPPGLPSQTTETLAHTPTRLPKRIGQYHIKSVIASGGMGTVYEAIQEQPHRTVALKLMKHGIASRSALRRFEYESQILARLRHPGIAQVYEAGTHRDDSGTTPYFAMEYIVGAKPITKYARERKLSTREKLELIESICDAVHHGHQKGIIHRDLKPSNILVDASGRVKIIDFGVARSTDSDLAVTTLQTDIGQLIGTLQYMSPEQCEADPHNIDTRSDVYALGVLFYELLCGKLPYDVTRVAMHEATRIIREQQPTKLSTIDKTLKGDVETICYKALEKDRERRYQSATDFAQDIRRYLNNEAIAARPASMMYQFRVLVRRNKPVFAAIAAVFVVLVGGVATSTHLYLEAESERQRTADALADSEVAREEAESVTNYLTEMLSSVRPTEEGIDVTVRQILDKASDTVDEQFPGKPLLEARVRRTIGGSYVALGHYDAAEAHLRISARSFAEHLGRQHRQTMESVNDLAYWFQVMGQLSAAQSRQRANIEIALQTLGEEHPHTLASMNNLANTLEKQGRYAEAEQLHRKVLSVRRRVLGDEEWMTLASMNNLGMVLHGLGKNSESARLFRETLEVMRRIHGEDHPDTLYPMNNLALVLNDQGMYAESEKLHRTVLETRRRILGQEHPLTIGSMHNIAEVLLNLGKHDEAAALFRIVWDTQRRVLGKEHPDTTYPMHSLALVLNDQGRHVEAEDLNRKTLKLRRRVLGKEHPRMLDTMASLAIILRDQGKHAEAEELLRKVQEIRISTLGEDHPEVLQGMRELVELLAERGKHQESEQLYRIAVTLHRVRTEAPTASAADFDSYAAFLLTCESPLSCDPDAALQAAKQAVNLTNATSFRMLETLARAYQRTDDRAKAIETQKKAVALLPTGESPLRTELVSNLAKYRQAAKSDSPE